MRTKLNVDRGVAGLTILLSLVTMLFIIGLLVMIFSLMGGELQDASYTISTATVTNETTRGINQTGYTLDNAGLFGFTNPTLVTAWYSNATGDNDSITSLATNITVTSAGVVRNATTFTWGSNMTLSYTYDYSENNSAVNVIRDTSTGIAGVTDWFPIFVVIGAMVVLILLTVIIITAIRGSGLMAGETA